MTDYEIYLVKYFVLKFILLSFIFIISTLITFANALLSSNTNLMNITISFVLNIIHIVVETFLINICWNLIRKKYDSQIKNITKYKILVIMQNIFMITISLLVFFKIIKIYDFYDIFLFDYYLTNVYFTLFINNKINETIIVLLKNIYR